MQLRTLSPPALGAPAELAALRRELTALFRWRLRWLPEVVSPRLVRAGRLLPVLLHTSFQRERLRDEAPGVAGMRFRRSWSLLAREFDLPAPFKAQRGAPLVEAVLLLPDGDGLAATVVVAPGLRPSDLDWVRERCDLARAVLAAGGAQLKLTVSEAAAFAKEPDAAARFAVTGALADGRLSAGAWSALETAARRPVGPATLVGLAAAAPTSLAALALTILCAGDAPAPLETMGRLLMQGLRAKDLADPGELAVRWAAEVSPHRDALLRALSLVRPHGAAPAPSLDAGQVLATAGELQLAAARALRSSWRHLPGPAARTAWRSRLGAGLPRALLPALGRQVEAAGPLRTALTRDGEHHLVRLTGGTVLGRGATPVQARVRALSILAAAALEPLLEHAEPPWRALATRLAQRRDRKTLLLVVEPAVPSGPPFDPINRGPGRILGFPGALAVRLAPGRRASGRVLTGEETIALLVREVQAGTSLEVVPSRSEAHPVAARLAQVAGLVRDASAGKPVALEAGGRVLMPRGGRVFRYPLDRFVNRPRTFVPDPDAPDLALSPGERRPVGLTSAGVVECRASLVDEDRASVLYTDVQRGWLREVVFLSELEEHLKDSRAVLQQADPTALLALRLSDGVEPALRRVGRAGDPVHVAVRGQYPHDLQAEIGGERFGGCTGGRSWREGAQAVLLKWPRTGTGRISVNALTVQVGGRRAVGLLALYARSVVLRRLRGFLGQELRALSAGQFVPKV